MNVQAGADIGSGAGDAAVALSAISTLNVDGVVNGGAKSGVLITNGVPYYRPPYSVFDPFAGAAPLYGWPGGFVYPSTAATINISTSGVISGATAIRMTPRSDNNVGFVNLTLSNAGIVTALGGPAVMAVAGTTITSIYNAETGYIGGISGDVNAVYNYGTIQGEAYPAVAGFGSVFFSNEGTITSGSSAATLAFVTGTVNNLGIIHNSGAGSAIETAGTAWVNNYSAGEIASVGGVAIRSGGGLSLTNEGKISGSVISTSASENSSIVSTGLIDGDVLLGGGNDFLSAGIFDFQTGEFSNISGIADGGEGIDTASFSLRSDQLLTSSTLLPRNFERFRVTLQDGAQLTIGQGTDFTYGLSIGGSGRIVVDGNISTRDTALSHFYNYPSALGFVNNGAIASTLTNDYDFAVALGSLTSGENHGSINAVDGSGISVVMDYEKAFINYGSIGADNLAASVLGRLDNRGSIESRDGIGVVNVLGGGVVRGLTSTNSGSILGKTVGLRIDTINFANSGTIGSDEGMGVDLGFYAGFENLAGGVVNGLTAAIGSSGSAYNLVVANAGTINGNVDLSSSYGSTYNLFHALPGGIVHGDLHLGEGNDIFVTDLINTGPGAFAGVTGEVSGDGFETIIYRVSQDSSAALTSIGIFDAVGYQISSGAVLTLDLSSPHALPVTLSGSGVVNLGGVISGANKAIIGSGTYYAAPGEESVVVGALAITSSASIELVRDEPHAYLNGAISLHESSSFTNSGTITVRDGLQFFPVISAITGGESVTNHGSILLDGAQGVSFSSLVTNSGTIRQTDGGATSLGIMGASEVVNSGTISTGGAAIGGSWSLKVTNSGTLESADTAAIVSSGYENLIVNTKAGRISGANGGPAILAGPTTIVNSGEIEGDVNLTHGFWQGNSTYINAGGTISGDLIFGSGNDIFLTRTGEMGVSGSIFGGEGQDAFGYSFESSQSVDLGGDLPEGFEVQAVGAFGSETVVTLTSPTGSLNAGIQLLGNGTFVNNTDISGSLDAGGTSVLLSMDAQTGSAPGFTNDATIEFGVAGTVRAFANNGVVNNARDFGAAAALQSPDSDLSVTNAGLLAATGKAGTSLSVETAHSLTMTNSGIIQANGGAYVLNFFPWYSLTYFAFAVVLDGMGEGEFTVRNTATGLIEATGERSIAVSVRNGVLNLVNEGIIRAGSDEWAAAIQTSDAADFIRNEAGGSITGLIDLNFRDDRLENYGTIIGDIFMGEGDDVLLQALGGTYTGTADGGSGVNTLIFDITGGASIPDLAQFVNFQQLSLTGTGEIDLAGPLPFESLGLDGGLFNLAAGKTLTTTGNISLTGSDGNEQVTNAGVIAGSVALGGGNDSFDNQGSVGGYIDLGEGNDIYRDYGGSVGSAQAGQAPTIWGAGGYDRLERYGGSPDSPSPLVPGIFGGFEQLAVMHGVTALSGTARFDSIFVEGGRFIGFAGSVLQSDQAIQVASGATFGSAGTIIGDLAIAGTLSPGASPGTMTIVGDVALAGGSTTLFEMTPTASDAIVVNGALQIGTGATLDITGERPLTPGTTYDLIATTEGIDGRFATISKAEAVEGYVWQSSSAVQLRSSFDVGAGASAQTTRTADYLNGLLINGEASEALLAAAPALLGADGTVHESAIGTISPEPYASVVQIGIENGLAISSAIGSADVMPMNEEGGIYSFGQVLGSWRHFSAKSGRGTGRADVRSSGFLGGVGYGNERVAVSAFIGRIDAEQAIGGVGARSQTDGLFFGGKAGFRSGSWRLGASAIWDRSSADTHRSLFDGTVAESRYRLRGVTFDGHIGYSAAIGDGWNLSPEIGVTHISVRRGRVIESGGGSFGLAVMQDTYKATFLNGDIGLKRPSNQTWQPYLVAGIRHQIDSDRMEATGGFIGTSAGLRALGAERSKSFGHIGAGFDVKLSKGVSLFARGDSEFGSDNNGRSINGGLRLGF